MNSQTSTKQTKAGPTKKDGWECRELFCYETKSKKIKWRPRHFRFGLFWESRLGCWSIARVITLEELGAMSINNSRGVTLVKRPIWRFHSLALIIYWVWSTVNHFTLEEKGAIHLLESRPFNLAFEAKFRNLSKRLTIKLPLGFVDLCGTNCRKFACSKSVWKQEMCGSFLL